MLASYPANILNHITPRSGIPSDSFKVGNALESFRARLNRSEHPNTDLTLKSERALRPLLQKREGSLTAFGMQILSRLTRCVDSPAVVIPNEVRDF